MGLLVPVMHCQFGGRPLIASALQEILKYLTMSPAARFARHEELANWALACGMHELTYRRRFFDNAVHLTG